MSGNAMPVVTSYPVCSTCEAPYVLRYSFVFSGPDQGEQWLWHRDCKHKSGKPVVREVPRDR